MQKGKMALKTKKMFYIESKISRKLEDFLNEAYFKHRETIKEIAKILGVSQWSIGEWLKKNGIPRRKRGTLVLKHFNIMLQI